MLVLSPKRDPLFIGELGSTARTATLCPDSISLSPYVSMNVLFPAPGLPVIPILKLFPLSFNCMIYQFVLALGISLERLLSTKVMAFAKALLSPFTSSLIDVFISHLKPP